VKLFCDFSVVLNIVRFICCVGRKVTQQGTYMTVIVLPKELCLNELDKNFDKQHDVACVTGSAPSEHLEDLLSSLQRHLLAYCYTNSADDDLVRT